jgi:pimeloyl-ACP methyl ester carboxylesterase
LPAAQSAATCCWSSGGRPQPDAAANTDRRKASIDKVRAGASAEQLQVMMQTQIKSLTGTTAIERNPGILAELNAQATLTPESVVAVQAGLAARPDSVPTVATISVPVLAIAGDEDPGVTAADMEAFNAAPGGCEFHLLPDAGHFAAYEQPQKVVALMAAWLWQFEG